MSDERELGAIRRQVLADLQTAIPLLAMGMIFVVRRDYRKAHQTLRLGLRILEKAIRSVYLLDMLSDPPT